MPLLRATPHRGTSTPHQRGAINGEARRTRGSPWLGRTEAQRPLQEMFREPFSSVLSQPRRWQYLRDEAAARVRD